MHRKLSRCAWGFRRLNNHRHSKNRQPQRDAPLARAAFEALENRRLMSSSVSFANGTLTLQGNATTGSSLTVSLVQNGAAVDANVAGVNLVEPTTSVKAIQITGGSGADYIFIDPRITATATATTPSWVVVEKT